MNFLKIYDFNNISSKYLNLLNNEILQNYIFVKYLNANNNLKITKCKSYDK
jgi:hypothetical protein